MICINKIGELAMLNLPGTVAAVPALIIVGGYLWEKRNKQ